MDDLVKIVSMDWQNGFLFIAGLIVLVVFIFQKTDWLLTKFGIVTRKRLEEEKRAKDIKGLKEQSEKNDEDMNELKAHVKKTDENVDKLCVRIEDLKASVDGVAKQVEHMQDKEDELRRNQLRDRIAQSYRYYAERKRWSHMDKEALEGLIYAYESVGGTNGFVHSKVIPESLTWELVDDPQ